MNPHRLLRSLLLLSLFSALAFKPDSALAGELKLEAHLIWGTDGAKPNDPKLKDVDSKLIEKLKKVFKWNHYFEVNRKSAAVAEGKAEKIKLSDKCEIEIANMGKSMIKVKLFGQGKLVRDVKHPFPPGECLVLGGDDKDDTAWFVVLIPK